jgi:hypothetical protein
MSCRDGCRVPGACGPQPPWVGAKAEQHWLLPKQHLFQTRQQVRPRRRAEAGYCPYFYVGTITAF